MIFFKYSKEKTDHDDFDALFELVDALRGLRPELLQRSANANIWNRKQISEDGNVYFWCFGCLKRKSAA